MTVVSRRLSTLINDRRGVTALEYGIIAVLMGTAVITSFTAIWSPLSPGFTLIGNFLVSATAAGF
jgi:Flp pilus assembly pilin Flp